MKVMHFPLAKIAIAFIVGLFIAHFGNFSSLFSIVFFGVSFLILVVSIILKEKNYFAFLVLIASFGLGLLIDCIHFEPNRNHHYLHSITDENELFLIEIQIKERLKSTLHNERYTAEVIALNNQKSCGKIIFNLRKDSLNKHLLIGSTLHTTSTFYKNKKPSNPNQFDYGNYLANQNIYAQIYADKDEITINPKVEKNWNYYASIIRNKIIRNLEQHHFKKEELSVVIALILGQQQDISKEVLRDYQYAGAVHILSVSGLHVGFILLFITTLLKPIPNNRKGTILKLIITLMGLWAFGVLAGLAPSVVRSVTMFSFVAVGLFLRRSVNIYHSLLVSMFLILLFRPSFLFDVGFQLSYLALFFIIWLQPIFKSIWTPKSKITTYFWDISTVSFAAQIGTLPLSIYYFHQFPGLFFITNIVILPLLSIILAIAILVVVLASFDYVQLYLMKLLEWSIELLNTIIAWVASFEKFIFKDIPMSALMMSSLYLVLISFFILIEKPNYRKITALLISVLAFQGSWIFTHYQTQKATEFIVFHQKKSSLIIERNLGNVMVYSNDTILKKVNENWTLNSYLVANFCKIENSNRLKNFYYCKDKRIAVIDSSGIHLNKNPDVLILINSPKLNLERLLQSYQPKEIVADASNYKSYKKLWKATCEKEKIPFHDTSEKGFYKL
ncbi:MAG: ComEC/Rec2 family competence protein [Flavobacteriales bacterium]|nr:ComEC/Rec2 family competence protein [Flavobacteriales bacterium]